MKSMTGFGSAEGNVGQGTIYTEIKSVNHRYSDIMLRIPNKMNSLDPKIKEIIKSKLFRGKVDLFLKDKIEIQADYTIVTKTKLARKYKQALSNLKKELEIKSDLTVLDVVDFNEIVKIIPNEINYDKLWPQIKKVVLSAVTKCDQMRIKEGAYLKNEQIKHIRIIEGIISKVRRQTKSYVKHYRSNLLKKIKPRNNGVDISRLQTEVSIQSEKIDITEEIARLASHLKQYKEVLNRKGVIGKELDFLLQEMNREINTMGSKTADMAISRLVIEAKAEVEKLREQVQNIE